MWKLQLQPQPLGATAPKQICKLAISYLAAPTDTSPNTLNNQLTSPLPAELRNKIYTFVSLSSKIRVDRTIQKYNSGELVFKFMPPDLLETCKQTRHEATTVVFKLATFRSKPHPGPLLAFQTSQSCNL